MKGKTYRQKIDNGNYSAIPGALFGFLTVALCIALLVAAYNWLVTH